MSGNYRGKVEMWANTGYRIWNMQILFKNLYDFWNSHPNAVMIASNYGAPSQVLSGSAVTLQFTVTNGNNTVTINSSAIPTFPLIQVGTVITFSNFLSVQYTVASVPTSSTFTLNTTFGGSSSGTVTANIYPGTQYYDGYQPFGQNAWFVVRLNATASRAADVYHMFHWYGNSGNPGGTIIAAPGFPALAVGLNNGTSQCYILHSAAIGVGGTGGSSTSVTNGYGNPWKGTSNNNGADTKTPTLSGTFSVTTGSSSVTATTSAVVASGAQIVFSNQPNVTYTVNVAGTAITITSSSTNGNSTGSVFTGLTNGTVTANSVGTTSPAAVWGNPPGGGTAVLAFPRSNSTGGSFNTQLQNMGYFASGNSSDTNAMRSHIVADDDSFCMMTDPADNNTYFGSFSGIFIPRPNITAPLPYMYVDSGSNAIPWSAAAATPFGDTAGTNTYQGGIVSATITNGVRGLQFDALPIFTSDISFSPNRNFATLQFDEFDYCVGVYEPSFYGFLGQLDWIRMIVNVQTCYTRSDFTRMFVGGPTVSNAKLSIPWDSQNNTVPRSSVSRAGFTFVSTNP